MRISRGLAALAAFFVIGAIVAGCGSTIPGNSVATVAGNPISLQAFKHWMYVAAKEQAASYAQQGLTEPPIVSSDPTNFSTCEHEIRAGIPALRHAAISALKNDCQQVYKQTETEVMNFLIQSYWLQAEAHKLGIGDAKIASDFSKLVKKQFSTKAKLDAYLASTLKTSGQTFEDIRFTNRVQTLFGKLVKRQEKPIDAKAIAAFYAAHKTSFGTPETRTLHLVRTKTPAQAQAAYRALKGGQSWNAVAKQYAADASAKTNGGLLTGLTSGQEESAVNTAIFTASPNQLVGPVKGIFGSYVLEVTKVTPATTESLAKATPAIKAQLLSTEGSTAQQAVLKSIEKHWKSQTTCRTPNYGTTYCSNYKAPAVKTTVSPTPTTTTSNTISVGGSTSTTSSSAKKKK